jgi:hypothetical protein
MIKELEWNVDGHRILLNLNKTSFDVSPGICPHGGGVDAPCYHEGISACVVNYFVNIFGLECNAGTVAAEPSLEIAWVIVDENKWDIDLVNLSFIPVTDPYFADWYKEVSSS